MSVRLLDHIGIVVHNLEPTLREYELTLGLKPSHIETYGDGLLKIAFLPIGPVHAVGSTKLELLQPLRPGTSAWNFLQQHGQGVEHLAFLVDDVDHELDRLAHLGIPMGDQSSRPGAGGMQIAFLNPQALSGMLAELVTPISQRGSLAM
ncbi:VOC family protein [Ktedonosporobacter rubrisoli]|uniref:VOC family protein n=1 Tax=Ktedonosporobacter rubrisoli TaxID=2509675 RepID=A0A4P6JQD0_KTERU|nr:VOC family protein [Ktedonosporobacter rubrisoli]QBD77627.1 VOC family protein [Ktedonosporobacter rubrisoli]